MLLKIILILTGLYIFFVVLPAVITYFKVYGRKEGRDILNTDYSGTYYEPFLPAFKAGFDWFSGLKKEEITVTNEKGECFKADYYDGGFKRTALLFHGFRITPLMNFCIVGKDLYDMGFNLLLVHERAHGKSGGKRTTLGVKEQEEVLLWVRKTAEMYPERELLLYGSSMGAAAVAFSADRLEGTNVRAMVLDSGYLCPDSQVTRSCRKMHVPVKMLTPVSRLILWLDQRVTFLKETSVSLEKTGVPALFIYGTGDTTVPQEDIDRAFDACASEKELFLWEGAEHTLAYPASKEAGREKLSGFLSRYFS